MIFAWMGGDGVGGGAACHGFVAMAGLLKSRVASARGN